MVALQRACSLDSDANCRLAHLHFGNFFGSNSSPFVCGSLQLQLSAGSCSQSFDLCCTYLAMIYAHLVLFNYRLIVAKFLIYDLIATTSAANAATWLPTTLMSHETDAPLPSANASNDLWPTPTLMNMMERAKTTSASFAPSAVSPAKSVRVLSRPRRYLSFPEGSSFTVCVTVTLDITLDPAKQVE